MIDWVFNFMDDEQVLFMCLHHVHTDVSHVGASF
jgi:hypothetical protein